MFNYSFSTSRPWTNLSPCPFEAQAEIIFQRPDQQACSSFVDLSINDRTAPTCALALTPYSSVNSAILPQERNHANSCQVCFFSIIDFQHKYYCLSPRGTWGTAFFFSFCMATFPSLLELQYTQSFEGIFRVRAWGSTIRRQAHEYKNFLCHICHCALVSTAVLTTTCSNMSFLNCSFVL